MRVIAKKNLLLSRSKNPVLKAGEETLLPDGPELDALLERGDVAPVPSALPIPEPDASPVLVTPELEPKAAAPKHGKHKGKES